MTLEQLRIFIAVAESQHVTRAASELNLTQSATSAAIAALESRYGIKLFDRIGRGIVLTQTGRDFLEEAREVVARAKAAAQVLDDLAGLKRGSLSLAASQTVANYWLPRRIETFRRAYPGIDLHVTTGNTEQVAQDVHRGAADLGFVEGEVDDPSLSIRRMEGDTLAVVVGLSHPWTGKTRITPKMLTGTSWMLREPGSGTRSMFEAALQEVRRQIVGPRCPARIAIQRSPARRRGMRRLRHGHFGSRRGAIAGRGNAASRQHRSAEAFVLRAEAQGALRQQGGKSFVCVVRGVNEFHVAARDPRRCYPA